MMRALLLAALVMALRLPASAADPAADHGRYLVHNVAMCTDCHGADLHGGAVPGTTVRAPSLAKAGGLPPAAFVSILEHGTLPPPMPHFGMTAADANAVARYLATVR